MKKTPWSGWNIDKPNNKERDNMWTLCKKRCFIGTTKKSFPICKRKTCKVSKKGLWSAYIRSQGLFKKTKKRKYRTVALRAKKQLNTLKNQK